MFDKHERYGDRMTQQEYDVCLQRTQQKFVMVEVLNKNGAIVDRLEGKAISGNINITNNSDIRRTCDIQFVLKGNTLVPKFDGVIWLNKLFRLQLGIMQNSTNEIIWFN